MVSIYSSSGASLGSYTYDAWGNCTVNATVTDNFVLNENPFRYRGYYYDVDLGLYYLNSRYYDSNIGRFISSDDFGHLGANGDIRSYNLYAYCSNNPVMYVDPDGHSMVGAIIFASGIFGGLLGAFSAATTGGNVVEGAVEGLFTGMIGSACGLLLKPLAAVAVSTFGAAFVDTTMQITTQYIESGSIDSKKLDYGRILKVGIQTGLGAAVPAYGQGAKNVVDAMGTALIWGEVSSIITVTDIIITNILATSRTNQSYVLVPNI